MTRFCWRRWARSGRSPPSQRAPAAAAPCSTTCIPVQSLSLPSLAFFLLVSLNEEAQQIADSASEMQLEPSFATHSRCCCSRQRRNRLEDL